MNLTNCKSPKELSERIQEILEDGLSILNNLRSEVAARHGPWEKWGKRQESEYEDLRKETKQSLSDFYLLARQQAINLRHSDPSLPELPASEVDPIIGLQNVQQWCLGIKAVKADLARREATETDARTSKFGFHKK